MISENRPLNPNGLTPQQLADLLSAASHVRITREQIERDIGSGAPTNQDGTMHLVQYTAWLLRELPHGNRSPQAAPE